MPERERRFTTKGLTHYIRRMLGELTDLQVGGVVDVRWLEDTSMSVVLDDGTEIEVAVYALKGPKGSATNPVRKRERLPPTLDKRQ